MSVINRMLQDLEARRAGNGSAPTAVRATPAEPDQKRLLLWLLGAAIAATVVALGNWPQWLSAQAARVPQPAAMVDAGAPLAVAVVAPDAGVDVRMPVDLAAPAPAPAPAPEVPKQEPMRVAQVAAPAQAMPVKPVKPAKPANAAKTPRRPDEAQILATAHYGLEPTLATPAAAQLATAPKAMAAPPDAAPAPAPARIEPTGRVDKQMSAQSPAQRAQLLYQQGMELSASGHGRMALERLQQALAIQPALTVARVHAVTLLVEHGLHAEAESLAREGLVLSPGEAQLSHLLARSLAGHGDIAAALAVLERSPGLGADAFGLRAGLLSQQGDFRRAAADYEQAVRLQPGNSLWWLGLGVALEAQGQPQQALRVYARAQSLGMDSHDLNVFLDQKLASLK